MAADRVAIVTDSTSDLPDGVAEQYDIQVVPLNVHIDGRVGQEGVDVSRADVVSALRARRQVSTSRPAPEALAAAYRKALDNGATHVVSVHISQELSGTCDAARLAAREFGNRTIRVVDSRSAAMGLGMSVLAAAEQAAGGGSVDWVASAAVEAIDHASCLFYVDSLDWLHRGGRVGTAAALLGTALSVKPILHIVDGRIVPLEKVRTTSKAIARLVQLAVDRTDDLEVDIALQHLSSPDWAADVADQLRSGIPRIRRFYQSEVGPVVGSHVGPGLIGVMVRRLG